MPKVIVFKLMLIGMLALSACTPVAQSARINLCNQLPTVSEKDTAQTIIEVDNFNEKYRAGYCQ